MDNLWFFNAMTVVSVIMIAAIGSLLVYMYYLYRSKPAPGVLLGHLTIFGVHNDGTHTKLEGSTVDSTAEFCNTEMTQNFKDILTQDLEKIIRSPDTDPDSETLQTAARSKKKLAAFREQIQNWPIEQICRVAVIKDGIFGKKHLIIQFGQPNKTLRRIDTYATHDPEDDRFSLSLGPTSKGVVHGTMYEFNETWAFDDKRFKLGRFDIGTIHIFVPEEPIKHDSPTTIVPEHDSGALSVMAGGNNRRLIAKFVLHMPNVVYNSIQIRSLEQQIRDKDIALNDSGEKLSALSVKADRLATVLRAFMLEEAKIEDLMSKHIDYIDGVLMLTFPVLLCFLAEALGISAVVGALLGSVLSSIIIFVRGR